MRARESSLQKLIRLGCAKPYNAKVGVKQGWALCCPFCEECKMEPLPDRKGFRCLGSQLQTCGKWVSLEQAAGVKGFYVVEE